MPGPHGSSASAIEPRTKYGFEAAAVLFHIIKKDNKSFKFFEALL
jgi:hypothetical protein